MAVIVDRRLEGLIPEAVLELADGAVVGRTPGFARRFDPDLLGADAVLQHLENLRFPPLVCRLRDDPEPAAADVYLSGHDVPIYHRFG